MLDRLRRAAAGWTARILIGLLVVSFALWGIGDVFGTVGGAVLARVGGQEVSTQTYTQALNNVLNDLRARGQSLSREDARRLGIDREVLRILVGQGALDLTTQSMGLAVSDVELARFVRKNPSYRDIFGQFDRGSLEARLLQSGQGETVFWAETRAAHLRTQLTGSVQAHAGIPAALAERLWRHNAERRRAAYVVLTPGDADAIPAPDDATLSQFISDNPGDFIRPETRDLVLIHVSPAQFASNIVVEDAEIEAEYARNSARYGQPERRRVEQMTFPTQAAAQAAYTRIQAGDDFGKIATERKLSEEDIALGTLGPGGFISAEIEAAATRLKKDEVSAPVAGPLGFVLLRVREILPGRTAALSDVKDDIRRDIAYARAADEIHPIYTRIEDERAAGTSLSEIAERLNLPFARIMGVHADGTGSDSRPAPGLPVIDGLPGRIFASQPGDEPDPLPTPDSGLVWIEVMAVNPSAILSLSEAREKAVAQWKTQSALESIQKSATKIIEETAAGGTFAERVRETTGLSLLSIPPRSRFFTNEVFSKEVMEALFTIGKGEVVSGPVGVGSGVVLMQLNEIVKGDDTKAGEDIAKLEDGLNAALADELTRQYVQGLEEALGVSIDRDALAAVFDARPASERFR